MDRPKVGVGVLIMHGNKILLGKRKNAHGAGQWAPPGGHLEYGESWETCARREVLEETGLSLNRITFFDVTNDIFLESQKHYVTIFMIAPYTSGQPRVCEPDKCESWEWYDVNTLPENIFLAFKHVTQQHAWQSLAKEYICANEHV